MELSYIRRRLTAEELNLLPIASYGGPISLVRCRKQLNKALKALRREEVIGFDTETRPSFKKGVMHDPSLIQLATAERVFLVQLSFVPFGEELAELMEDPAHLKVGVAVDGDMHCLGRLRPFTPAGHVDLAALAERHEICNRSLRSLCASFFGERISKGPQCSNWSLPTLTRRQIVYAATDAWVGRRIFMRMRELGLAEAS